MGFRLVFSRLFLDKGFLVETTDAPVVGADEFPESEFGMDFLSSDPDELLAVDGLDDPMDRLRLRDSDTNSILDMIQMNYRKIYFETAEFDLLLKLILIVSVF